MGTVLGSNFTLQTALPLDSRTVVADLTARDAINSLQRYEGLLVYVVSEATNFQLIGGITNSDWQELSGGGGGGGASSLEWVPYPGSEPLQGSYNFIRYYNFSSGASQALTCTFKVPASYQPGSQILANLHAICIGGDANDGVFSVQSRLMDPTDITDPWLETFNETKTGWLPDHVYQLTIEVTDASGEINGTAVQPGDVISIYLSRETSGGVENTQDIWVLKDTLEVTLV